MRLYHRRNKVLGIIVKQDYSNELFCYSRISMHVFFGSYKAKVTWDLSSFDDKSFVKRTHSEGDFQLTQVTLPKFLNDKYFAEIDDCFLATEGVLFEADKPEEAIARYRNGETTFWNSWRGSFAGVL